MILEVLKQKRHYNCERKENEVWMPGGFALPILIQSIPFSTLLSTPEDPNGLH